MRDGAVKPGHGLAFFLIGLALAVVLTTGPADARSFHVYDATYFTNKPDLSRLGVIPLRVLYSGNLWEHEAYMDQLPDPALMGRDTSKTSDPSGMVVLDIENWVKPGFPGHAAPDKIAKFVETLKRFKAAWPGLKFGVFSVVPNADYFRALKGPGTPQYREWQNENDERSPIAAQADALFPEVYTFYPDAAAWQKYAQANISEARRLAHGKPVYCFLWPQYHPSEPLAWQFLPADYWRVQLDTCRQSADGIVIWGGVTYLPDGQRHVFAWDDNAPWWKATVDFLKANSL